MKCLRDSKGSSMVFVMIMLSVLSVCVLGFLVSSLSYATQSNSDRYSKQAYLTARGVLDALCQEIEDESSSVQSLLDQMTPPIQTDLQTNEEYQAYKDSQKWTTLDLGEVSFSSLPSSMAVGTTTAQMTMIDWDAYELSVTATSGTVTETVSARISADHIMVGGTSTSTSTSSGTQNYYYLDYNFGTANSDISGSSLVDDINLSSSGDTLVLDAPLLYTGDLTSSAPIQSNYDILLWDLNGSWDYLTCSKLTTTRNILLDDVRVSADLIQAGGDVILTGTTTVDGAIYCDTLYIYGDVTIQSTNGTPTIANRVVIDGSLTLGSAIYANDFIVMGSSPLTLWWGSGISTPTGQISLGGTYTAMYGWTAINTSVADVTVDIPSISIPSRTKPTWANLDGKTIYSVNSLSQLQGGNYYTFSSGSTSFQWETLPTDTDAPIYVVVPSGAELTVSGLTWDHSVYYILQGNAILNLTDCYTRVYADNPGLTQLDSDLESLMASAWANIHASLSSGSSYNYNSLSTSYHTIVEGYADQMSRVSVSGNLFGTMTVPLLYASGTGTQSGQLDLEVWSYSSSELGPIITTTTTGGSMTSTFARVEYFN